MLRAVVCAMGLWAGPLMAQQASPTETVILDQLSAFQNRDLARAFDYASDGIRSLFGTPERFGHMVEYGYPMVWAQEGVRFGGQRAEGRFQVKTVILTDGAGALHVLEYLMIEVDGAWKINGVRLVAPQGLGA